MLNSIITGTEITAASFLICTAVSIILGILTALLSMYENKPSQSFVITLAITPAIVQVIIMLVNGNIGTGLAVAGAFGLVRFRSASASGKEISLIFLSMAIGLACGMGYVMLAGIFFLAGLGSLASFIFARYFVPRHFCFTVYFTVLACLILLSELLEKGRPVFPALAAAALSVLFVFNLAQGGLDIAVTYKHFREREAAIQEALDAGEREIRLPVYESATAYSAPHQLLDLSTQAHDWPNCSLEDYYGIESIYGVLPEETEAPLP